jgi:hypothetical protein
MWRGWWGSGWLGCRLEARCGWPGRVPARAPAEDFIPAVPGYVCGCAECANGDHDGGDGSEYLLKVVQPAEPSAVMAVVLVFRLFGFLRVI